MMILKIMGILFLYFLSHFAVMIWAITSTELQNDNVKESDKRATNILRTASIWTALATTLLTVSIIISLL